MEREIEAGWFWINKDQQGQHKSYAVAVQTLTNNEIQEVLPIKGSAEKYSSKNAWLEKHLLLQSELDFIRSFDGSKQIQGSNQTAT